MKGRVIHSEIAHIAHFWYYIFTPSSLTITQMDKEIFSESNRFARDLAGDNWFKFEKVGDKVGGVIRDMFEMPSRNSMPAQRCFTLEMEKGELVNVGLKRTSYILSRTDALQVGDQLGVKFEKEIPPKQKGFYPAKSMIIFSKMIGERSGFTAKSLDVPAEVSETPESDVAF